MRIGNLTVDGRALLAPMAGVTDVTFRRLCRRFGAGIVYSEFLSTDGLVHNRMNQNHKLPLAEDEHPVAYQLFGARVGTFGPSARALAAYGPDLIDLNFGCPAKKVVRNNGGAAILRDLDLLEQIVRAVAEVVPVPVTVKMRAGWDSRTLVYREAAERAIAGGAQAITLHARTRADGPWADEYRGRADWSYIADLKRAVSSVPIIGNGDVRTAEDARRMLDETACDAVMVGRAAIGRPWLFAQINHYLETGTSLPEPAVPDRLALAWFNLVEKVKCFDNEVATIRFMRRMMGAYLRGIPGVHTLRGRLMTLETTSEIRDLFANYLEQNPDLPRIEGDDWLSRFVPLDRDALQRPRTGVALT